jgi:XTP/dITP diphosphohydrolase
MAGSSLLLATSNPGKRVELLAFLPTGIEVLTLADLQIDLPPEEGETFAEIAAVKATVAAGASGLIALADDSGLEVDALGGLPGIRSARYAGASANDARNREKLLSAMRNIPTDQRTARFRCAVALARPDGEVTLSNGACEGSIGFKEVGTNGFGYDSLFLLPSGLTMAQLPLEEKNQISHRADAYRQIAPVLTSWLDRGREGSS